MQRSKTSWKQDLDRVEVTVLEEPKPVDKEKPGLPEPTFIKIEKLKPGTSGHNLIARVVDINVVLTGHKSGGGNPSRVAEIVIGDETGIISFTAKNEQIDLSKKGETIVLRNAHVKLHNHCMRLAVDEWGSVQTLLIARTLVTCHLDDQFKVNTSNNVSNQKFDIVYEYE